MKELSAFSLSSHGNPTRIEEGNIDVFIRLEDGSSYNASFFTLENIKYLMDRYQQTGENMGGLYFWAVDCVIVRDLSEETIRKTVQDLIADGILHKSATRMSE